MKFFNIYSNLYIAHKKLSHKALRVHNARYTQCMYVNSRKLKTTKRHIPKIQTALPSHAFPKVKLYIVKYKKIKYI